MADFQWVLIDSWHILDPDGDTRTVCGLDLTEHDVKAKAEKLVEGPSCENCLRLVAKALDEE